MLAAVMMRAIPSVFRRTVGRLVKKVFYWGISRYCPVCQSRLRKFYPAGNPPRPDALCPVCGSVERHRLIWLFLQRKMGLVAGRSVRLLHIAPEKGLAEAVKGVRGVRYVSGSISIAKNVMVRLNITQLPHRADTFDGILCVHVLEHVAEDRQAMREFLRVLKPGGWAILHVPVKGKRTIEGIEFSREERERLFGHPDHVRSYGEDYTKRLEEVGFRVTVEGFGRRLGKDALSRFGLVADEDIYLCRKDSRR